MSLLPNNIVKRSWLIKLKGFICPNLRIWQQAPFCRGRCFWPFMVFVLLVILPTATIDANHAISPSVGDTVWAYVDNPIRQYMFWTHTSEGIQDAVHHWKNNYGMSQFDFRIGTTKIHWFGIFPPNYRPFINSGREEMIQYTNEKLYPFVDPLAEAIRAAKREGMVCNVWLQIFDEFAPSSVLYGGSEPFPHQSMFQKENPQYVVVSRDGTDRQYGVLEFAYPEVRQYFIHYFEWLMQNYDMDGLYISTRTHSLPAESGDQYGFNDIVVQEFQNRYGIDILTDNRFNWKHLFFDKNDPVLEDWRSLRGEYITQFLRELRIVADRYDVKVKIAIPQADHIGPPIGNLILDWRTWVQEGLIDELIVGHVTGNTLYPESLRTTLHYVQIDDPDGGGDGSVNLTSLSEFRNFIDSNNSQVQLYYETLYRTGTYNPQNFSSQLAYCDGLRFPSGIDLHYSYVPTDRWWATNLVYTDFDGYVTGDLNGQGGWIASSEHQIQDIVVYGGSGKAISSTRGSTPVSASINFGSPISDEAIEWSFWARRASSDSQCVWALGPSASVVRIGFYIPIEGSIMLQNGTSWATVAPADTVAAGQWIRLSMYMNISTGILDAYYYIDGQGEELPLATDFAVSGNLTDMQMLLIAPQPGMGNTTYTDEMELFGVPARVDYLPTIGSPPPFPEWTYPEKGIRISQNFDDPNIFAPDKGSPQGFDTDYSAVWMPLSLNDAPGIDNNFSYSGNQSLILERGNGSLSGRVNIPMQAGKNYEAQFWLYRDNTDSSLIVAIGNGNGGSDPNENSSGKFYCNSSGLVLLYDNLSNSYIDSGLLVSPQIWTKISLKFDSTELKYSVSVIPQGQSEQNSDISASLRDISVNSIIFLPQLPETGHVCHIDDILLRESINNCSDVWRLGYGYSSDVNKDCKVNLLDIAVVAQDWLKCNDPNDINCNEI